MGRKREYTNASMGCHSHTLRILTHANGAPLGSHRCLAKKRYTHTMREWAQRHPHTHTHTHKNFRSQFISNTSQYNSYGGLAHSTLALHTERAKGTRDGRD